MPELGFFLIGLAGSGFMALALIREEWPPRWSFTLGPGVSRVAVDEITGEVRID